MQTSEAGVAFIKRKEGLRLAPYLDKSGFGTIGYGHLITASEHEAGRFSAPLSQDEAEILLMQDVAAVDSAIARIVTVPLTQSQHDAIADWVFNLGAAKLQVSTMLKNINRGNYEIAHEIVKWCYRHDPATGAMMQDQDLLNRRLEELQMWNTEPTASDPLM